MEREGGSEALFSARVKLRNLKQKVRINVLTPSFTCHVAIIFLSMCRERGIMQEV